MAFHDFTQNLDRIQAILDLKKIAQNRPFSYFIHTFGCQMNVRDSETVAGVLEQCGLSRAVGMEDADIILFNTCCVRDLAEKKALAMIGRTKAYKLEKPELLVGVFGCMMQQPNVEETLRRYLSYIDIAFGTNAVHLLPEMILVALSGEKAFYYGQADPSEEFDLPAAYSAPPLASINIIHGCNNFCSYCIVPYVRGREKSKPMDLILKEAEQLMGQGYQEIMLLGQNVNSYGKDIKTSFSALLRELNALGVPRIRFMTSHPKDLSEDVIEAMADCRHVCNHLHLPVQSGSDRILSEMNRKYDTAHYMRIIGKLKQAIPEIALTTDIIVGFPGETETDFLDTLQLVEAVRYDAAFTFNYSPRRGTPAAVMEQQVPKDIKTERLERLVALQKRITAEIHTSLLGTTQQVLVEGISKKNQEHLTGRIERGRIVNFKGNKELIGQFCDVKITEAFSNSLFGIQ